MSELPPGNERSQPAPPTGTGATAGASTSGSLPASSASRSSPDRHAGAERTGHGTAPAVTRPPSPGRATATKPAAGSQQPAGAAAGSSDPSDSADVTVTTVAAPAAEGGQPDDADADAGGQTLALLRDVIAWGNREVDALASSAAANPQHLADIHVRLAFITADMQEGDDAWAHHLAHVASHPLGTGLLLAHGICTNEPEPIRAALAAIESSSADKARRAMALCNIAETWLYRFGDAAAAVEVARAALDPTRAGASTGDANTAWARELRQVYMAALAAGEQWRELGTSLTDAAAAKGADIAVVAEAAHVLFDRLDDGKGAALLLRRLSDEDGGAAAAGRVDVRQAIHRYRALCIALEVAAAQPQATWLDVAALQRQRLSLLGTIEGTSGEAAAVRFLLADHLREQDAAAAGELLARLTEGSDSGWGPHLAAMAAAVLAREQGEWVQMVGFLSSLASSGGAGPLSICHAWRAAEIADARVGDGAGALEWWRAVAADVPGSEQSDRGMERLLLQAQPEELALHLESLARADSADDAPVDPGRQAFALRRAAAVVESRLGDIDRAVALQDAAAEHIVGPLDHEHLLRLHRRRGDADALAAAYRALSDKTRDARSTTACLCAVGAIEWRQGRLDAAEEAFAAAARQSPRDPVARIALAALYRATERRRELVTVVARLVELVADQELMVELLRELGQLYASEFNNTRRARELLERALSIDPDHAAALYGMAELHDRARQWDKSIELRRRAAEAAGDGERRAALWMEIGEVEENRRKDDEAALRAYEAASDADPRAGEALHAQARIHRRNERFDELLEILRAELALEPDDARTVQIQLDIAELTGKSSAGSQDSTASLEAYLSALEVDPGNETALAGVERICRAEKRWDLLAEAYRGAPRSAANLPVLAEALEALAAWSELAEVRRQQIEQTTSKRDKGRLCHGLATIYQNELKDLDSAADMYREAIASGGAPPETRQALARMLEKSARWSELEAAYQDELAALPDADAERRLALLLELGALRRDHLERLGDAALAYEEALELSPQHIPTLEALAGLYQRLEREEDLLRVLSAHSSATDDQSERCELYKRIAEMKQARDDVDGAIVAYRQAFEAQPANRSVFTDMEKLCYQHERWNDTMALYDAAIERVEGGLNRAYRLGDLFARRGQVLLQYLKQLDKAAASYLRVIELDPDNDTAINYLESIYTQTLDWPALISAYEARARSTSDDEQRIDALRRAARVAGNKLKEPEESARLYEKILEIDADEKESLDTLERFYERAQEWDKLVSVLKRRLDAAPAGETATALLRRIAQICEERLRDPQRAVDYYRRILDIAPGNKEGLDALGRIFESTEQWTDFIDVTRRQIRVTSDRNIKALLYFKCGSVMEAKFGKEEDAIRYYDAAIKTSPSCLPAVHGLRDLYRRREDWPRVIQTLELEVKLWQDKKERAGVSAQIGRIYAEYLGDPQMALHYYESALAIDPECLPANQALFDHYFENEEWERAKPLAQSLAQKVVREGDPSARSEFYRKHGIVCRMTGDPRMGAESLVVALEIKPNNQDALDALGDLANAQPEAYGFDLTYRELEKIYRKREDAQALLARVRVAQAVMVERQGDLDGAQTIYEEAAQLCPGDFGVMNALVDFHCNMRHWPQAVEAIDRFVDEKPPPSEDARVQAMMRQVEIYADCEMDPHRAIAVLREVLRLRSSQQEAYYLLAQEYFVLQRHAEAQEAIDRAIELAAAPGIPVSPETLARYYYYRGRIMDATGDARKAAAQYRRAVEYDPGYAPPALMLARRAMENGDQSQAETLLINAAHAAMEQGGVNAAVPLQRGLARILLAAGDRKAAVEAYRGILNVQPDSPMDRVALAEIYAEDDMPRAIAELHKLFMRDLRHASAYQLLARFHAQSGDIDRAKRVLEVKNLLGFAEDSDVGLIPAEKQGAHAPVRQPLSDALRQQILLTDAATGPVGEIFSAIAADVSTLFPQPSMGENLVPVQTLDDPAFKTSLAELTHLYGVEPEIYLGEQVPGGIVAMAYPRRILVLDHELLRESDVCRRFLLGWAFENIRGGYALLFGLTQRQRVELGALLTSLLASEADRAVPTNEFIQSLPRRAVKVIERYAGQGYQVDIDIWIEGMLAIAKRAGLFACDELDATVRMIARLHGERLESGPAGTAGLVSVLGGPDMIRFYLSDEYHRLREILSNPSTTTGI